MTKKTTSHGPVNVVFSLDGSSFEDDCSCPICAQLAHEGTPRYASDGAGNVRRLPPAEPPPMMRVVVTPGIDVAPYVGVAPFDVDVPVGCSARDFVGFLWFTRDELRSAVPAEALVLRIGRRRLAERDSLSAGDRVTLLAIASRGTSAKESGMSPRS